MEIEYIGELLSDGHLSVDPVIFETFKKGQLLKIIIKELPEKSVSPKPEKYDAATQRIIAKMRKAKSIGVPDDPQELSHSRLMEERIEEKFKWKG